LTTSATDVRGSNFCFAFVCQAWWHLTVLCERSGKSGGLA
jgi:hypothetical protein